MSLIDKLEKFHGTGIKPGRVTIKGFPVDIEDSDGSYISMNAVDIDAAKGLVKQLRNAKFKANNKGTKIMVTEDLQFTMEHINEMIKAVESEDQDAFNTAFASAISETAKRAVAERKIDLTAEMFNKSQD